MVKLSRSESVSVSRLANQVAAPHGRLKLSGLQPSTRMLGWLSLLVCRERLWDRLRVLPNGELFVSLRNPQEDYEATKIYWPNDSDDGNERQLLTKDYR